LFSEISKIVTFDMKVKAIQDLDEMIFESNYLKNVIITLFYFILFYFFLIFNLKERYLFLLQI